MDETPEIPNGIQLRNIVEIGLMISKVEEKLLAGRETSVSSEESYETPSENSVGEKSNEIEAENEDPPDEEKETNEVISSPEDEAVEESFRNFQTLSRNPTGARQVNTNRVQNLEEALREVESSLPPETLRRPELPTRSSARKSKPPERYQ